MSQAKDTAASRLRYYRGLFLVKPLPGPRPKGADAPIGASALFSPHSLAAGGCPHLRHRRRPRGFFHVT